MNDDLAIPEEPEILKSAISAEELRQITNEYTDKLRILYQEFYERTNFVIEDIATTYLHHLTTESSLPSEIIIKIAPGRSYYKGKKD